MELVGIIASILDIADKLIARGQQTGELTDEQRDLLQDKAEGIFDKYANPAPPPEGNP